MNLEPLEARRLLSAVVISNPGGIILTDQNGFATLLNGTKLHVTSRGTLMYTRIRSTATTISTNAQIQMRTHRA